MITAKFEDEETFNTVSDEVWQYDYGQVLQIEGLNLAAAVEIDFSTNSRGDATAYTMIGTTSGAVTRVTIPDEMFDLPKTRNYEVYAYIFETDSSSGETTHMVTIPVMTRPKREEYSGSGDSNPFDDVMAEVREALTEAKDAAAQATLAAAMISDELDQIEYNTENITNLLERMSVAESEIYGLTVLSNQNKDNIAEIAAYLEELGLSVVDGAINTTYKEV